MSILSFFPQLLGPPVWETIFVVSPPTFSGPQAFQTLEVGARSPLGGKFSFHVFGVTLPSSFPYSTVEHPCTRIDFFSTSSPSSSSLVPLPCAPNSVVQLYCRSDLDLQPDATDPPGLSLSPSDTFNMFLDLANVIRHRPQTLFFSPSQRVVPAIFPHIGLALFQMRREGNVAFPPPFLYTIRGVLYVCVKEGGTVLLPRYVRPSTAFYGTLHAHQAPG